MQCNLFSKSLRIYCFLVVKLWLQEALCVSVLMSDFLLSLIQCICYVADEEAGHSGSDTEGSEFVPDTDNTNDDDDAEDDSSDHSASNSDDDDMENLLFELSDMSNF